MFIYTLAFWLTFVTAGFAQSALDFRVLGEAVRAHVAQQSPGWRLYGIEVLESRVVEGAVRQQFRAVLETQVDRFVFPAVTRDEFVFVEYALRAGERQEVLGRADMRLVDNVWAGNVVLESFMPGIVEQELLALGDYTIVLPGSISREQALAVLASRDGGVEAAPDVHVPVEQAVVVPDAVYGSFKGDFVCQAGPRGVMEMRTSRAESGVYTRLSYAAFETLRTQGIAEVILAPLSDGVTFMAAGDDIYTSVRHLLDIAQVRTTWLGGGFEVEMNLGDCVAALVPVADYERVRAARVNIVADRIAGFEGGVVMRVGEVVSRGRIIERSETMMRGVLDSQGESTFEITFPAGLDAPVIRVEGVALPGEGCEAGVQIGADMVEGLVVISGSPSCGEISIQFE